MRAMDCPLQVLHIPLTELPEIDTSYCASFLDAFGVFDNSSLPCSFHDVSCRLMDWRTAFANVVAQLHGHTHNSTPSVHFSRGH